MLIFKTSGSKTKLELFMISLLIFLPLTTEFLWRKGYFSFGDQHFCPFIIISHASLLHFPTPINSPYHYKQDLKNIKKNFVEHKYLTKQTINTWCQKMQEENFTQQKGNKLSKTLIKEKIEEECNQSNESMVILSALKHNIQMSQC